MNKDLKVVIIFGIIGILSTIPNQNIFEGSSFIQKIGFIILLISVLGMGMGLGMPPKKTDENIKEE